MPKKAIRPEVVYLRGGITVPAKSVSYREDGTGIREVVKPSTHKFENDLRLDLKKELEGVTLFPTREEVLVCVVHGCHAERDYKGCDLDNRAKTILDALKDVIYLDDSQVKMLWTHKAFLKHEPESFYRISIKILDKKSIRKITTRIKQII